MDPNAVFLLDPANREILEGIDRRVIQIPAPGWLRPGGVLIATVTVCALIYFFPNPSLLMVLGFFLAGLVTGLAAVVAVFFWMTRRIRRLLNKGEVIIGELTAYSSTISDPSQDSPYIVTVGYEFSPPGGARLGGSTSRQLSRSENAESPAPKPGTPVAVLYADPQLYVLL